MVEPVNHEANSADYALCMINRGGNLVIQNKRQNNYFVRTASEILTDQQLLKGFSSHELMQIRALAEHS